MELQRVPLGDQAFDARFSLFGHNAESVRNLFNPSLREKLAGAEIPLSMVVRGNGEWLLFNVKGFRSFYGWPAVQRVTQDLRPFVSWIGKAVATAELFFPIETDATTFMIPSAEGASVSICAPSSPRACLSAERDATKEIRCSSSPLWPFGWPL